MSLSIEIRLKQIREAIDKNVEDILEKYNAKKVFLDEPFDEITKDMCPSCFQRGLKHYLKYCYVNLEEAIYKCENSICLYPFQNFKYKNYANRTIYRFEQKINDSKPMEFKSPTKVEQNSMDGFNLNDWFGCPTDLDKILNSSAISDEANCNIEEIIKDICQSTNESQSINYSENKNEQSPKLQYPRLSKSLEYITHKSPLSIKETRDVKQSKRKYDLASTLISNTPMRPLHWINAIHTIENQIKRDVKTPNQKPKEMQSMKVTETIDQLPPILVKVAGTSTSFILSENHCSVSVENNNSFTNTGIETSTNTNNTSQICTATAITPQSDATKTIPTELPYTNTLQPTTIYSDFQFLKTKPIVINENKCGDNLKNEEIGLKKQKKTAERLLKKKTIFKQKERRKTVKLKRAHTECKPSVTSVVCEESNDDNNRNDDFKGFEPPGELQRMDVKERQLIWLR